MTIGAAALPDSVPGDGTSGYTASLYSLTLWPIPRFPFFASLAFPLLTELLLVGPMKDAQLELLLPACAQLLRLDCVVSESWNVVLIAARCCRCLLKLSVRVEFDTYRIPDAAIAAPQPVTLPFLPQLLKLTVDGGDVRHPAFSDFSLLRPFTEPPHAQLRHVDLKGRGLTAQHVLLLGCLPRLLRLKVEERSKPVPVPRLSKLQEAGRRARQRLLSRAAEGRAEREPHRLTGGTKDRKSRLDQPPLGPHQQEEMRQRVLEAARLSPGANLLEWEEGEEAAMRAAFFAELRSMLTAAAASRAR
jgi:hypothetical protein